MWNRLICGFVALIAGVAAWGDTIPDCWHRPLQWRVGIEASAGAVPGTNAFLRGINSDNRVVNTAIAGALRADFSFDPMSKSGRLYRGVYQGIGIGINSFGAATLLGTPVSAYVYQGAPIVRFKDRLWLGYEWKFGAAFGWRHGEQSAEEENIAVSTPVTAHMGVALKLHYRLASRWILSVGAEGSHFSNGNTSWPNAGVNTLGGTVGVAYVVNPIPERPVVSAELEREADRGRWFYDITLYGAWRKRWVMADDMPQFCPGRFGIAGVQIAPMRRFNRYFAAGASLDMQWDESAGLEPYWVEGTHYGYIKFYRPPFGKQLSVGLSAHAELTMPIFSINVGLGYDMLRPEGNQRFYQSLTLKTFVTRRLYINTGYRLGRFKYPQNLMLGIGIRL